MKKLLLSLTILATASPLIGMRPYNTLLDAAMSGDVEQVKVFHQQGADLNMKNHCGCTPLMLALLNYHNIKLVSGSKYKELVEYLLEQDADLTIKSVYGDTALSIARKLNNDYPEVENLIKKKHNEKRQKKIMAMINARENNPTSPLYKDILPRDMFNVLVNEYVKESDLK